MPKPAKHIARRRLDDRLRELRPIERFQAPPKGWVRAIRDVLGMPGAALGRRLGVSPQAVDRLEKSEAAGSVSLTTLRRAAAALDCTLVYALVPNTSLEETVSTQARKIALRDLTRVSQTMKLEAQDIGDTDLERRLADYVRDVLRERDLWREP
jgi:predicted DNA-binding mobile mystery protein A